MNWDRIEDDWQQFTGNVNERWDNLTEGQLAGRVQETYGLTNGADDAPHQLTDWQQRLTLGPGDVLSFHLFGSPELTREEVPIGPTATSITQFGVQPRITALSDSTNGWQKRRSSPRGTAWRNAVSSTTCALIHCCIASSNKA